MYKFLFTLNKSIKYVYFFVLDNILEDKLNKIKTSCNNCANGQVKIEVISWVTKSLITRNHAKAILWIDEVTILTILVYLLSRYKLNTKATVEYNYTNN